MHNILYYWTLAMLGAAEVGKIKQFQNRAGLSKDEACSILHKMALIFFKKYRNIKTNYSYHINDIQSDYIPCSYVARFWNADLTKSSLQAFNVVPLKMWGP